MSTHAIFWDRDNTLIADPGYISEPDQVTLLPGVADALRRASEAGFENIIVTNQSGVARGLFDEAALERIHDRLCALLAAEGAKLDAIYYCPYLDGDEAKVEAYRRDSDLRKPRPGMLLKAALERKIELAGSWSIGDSLRDAHAGRAAGCRTVLIDAEAASREKGARPREVDFVAASPLEAVDIVLKHTRLPSRGGELRSSLSAGVADPATTLQEILRFLRGVERRQRAEDFSLAMLIGALAQLAAIGAMIWATFSVLRSESWGEPIVRLLFAGVLQLMALTAFVIGSRRG